MGVIFLRNKVSGAVADAFSIGGASPELVAAFTVASDGSTAGEYFRLDGADSTFGDLFTFSRSGTATYFDASGVLQTAADGVARRNAHYYNSAWLNGGVQLEAAAATQLLHGTNSIATQTETVTAQAYTLQFRGTGSIALTGAHTATLSGTGANDLVSLTFTPSAGTLTLTPSGTVDYPQLEVGNIPTSYIPNTAGSGTVTRAAETLSIAGADTPANTTAVSISMKGLMTYADTNGNDFILARQYASPSDFILFGYMRTNDGTGKFQFQQSAGGTLDFVQTGGSAFSPGVNVSFNLASRHTASAVNAASAGTALMANTTPTALPDLSANNISLGYTIVQGFSGFISEFRMWGADIGDSGIAEVTT